MDWCSDRQSSVSYLIFPIEHHPDALSVESLAHTHPSVVNITHKLGVEWGGGGARSYSWRNQCRSQIEYKSNELLPHFMRCYDGSIVVGARFEGACFCSRWRSSRASFMYYHSLP